MIEKDLDTYKCDYDAKTVKNLVMTYEKVHNISIKKSRCKRNQGKHINSPTKKKIFHQTAIITALKCN